MANEPTLRKSDIEDLEDRVTILEGGTPEPHSNTMTKPELEELDDRITVLEGGTPGTHTNPMRFEFFTSIEERVENIEDNTFDVVFETHLESEGPGHLKLKDNVDFPEEYWTDGSGDSFELKDIENLTLKLDGHQLSRVAYVVSFGFYFSLPSDELAEIISKYGTSFEGCPVEIKAPEGIFELNGAKSKAINLNELYAVEHKPLWLVIPAGPTNYTLTYDYNGAKDPTGASISEGDSYPAGTDVELTLDPSQSGWVIPDGKEFAGWTTVKGADYTKVTHIVLNSNITVYAFWTDAEPNLVNISVDEEVEGVWIKPEVEIDVNDPYNQQIYEKLDNEEHLNSLVVGKSSASQTTIGSTRIELGCTDYSLQTEYTDNGHSITITYSRNETATTLIPNDKYKLSGTAYVDGKSIDLGTITRPIYLPITSKDTMSFTDSVESDNSAAFVCKFFFREDNGR